jgi:shikimate kinase
MAPKLILTGFMATGKSAVARAIAHRLAWRLIDCDERIIARTGRSIPELFRTEGEARFRVIERELIQEIANDPRRCPQSGNLLPAVIATGGGAILDQRNLETLSRCGIVVCLTARPEVIARRVGSHAMLRPLLATGGKPVRERIADLIEERREAYERVAVRIDTSDFSVEQAATAAIAGFAEYAKKSWAVST